MTDREAVDDDVEAVVEDTELPRRLKNRVYETIVEKREEYGEITAEQAGDIAEGVESRYVETRVDPLDPVGTISAQSIGEPGTQMSIDESERVLVRRNGETETVRIGPLVDSLLDSANVRDIDGHEVALAPDEFEVLSLGADEKIGWKPVEEVSRHAAPEELLEIELESGRTIQATKSHSFVTRQANEIVPTAGEELDTGDWLPVVGEFDAGGDESVDLKQYLPSSDYWFTSVLTDGGAVSETPAGLEQTKRKLTGVEAGELDAETAYPVQGTVGLPERFPLDEGTGFFIGAWLADGTTTDRHTGISNIDPALQGRIREFADRFGLSVNEYDSSHGFGDGPEIRLNGTVLAEFLDASCRNADGDRTVPGFAFGASDAFVEGLLRGYFSGDGNVARNAVRSASTSERLTFDIGLLLSRVGVYARFGTSKGTTTLRIPKKFVPRFAERVGFVGDRKERLETLVGSVEPDDPDACDQIPNFGDALECAATSVGIPQRQVNSATERQRVGRSRLERLVDEIERRSDERPPELDVLDQAVNGDVVWERIERIEEVTPTGEYVYDFSVEGLETFTTAQGVVTHNTMNTFHYAGVAEIDVTQGLPRLIELVDARKEPDTPMMTVHLEDEYATDREKAHEVVWKIESTGILALGDVSTNVADMLVRIDLNDETLLERWPTYDDPGEVAAEIAATVEGSLGVEARRQGTVIEFGPNQPSYRELLQLVEQLRDVVFKGIEDIDRVVIRKEEVADGEEFVLYTEGSAFGDVLDIEGVDASRTTCNNIHEIHDNLGIEAAREAIIDETMNTLEEQGLGDVNVRHLMLVADIMTNDGEIRSIGRHGISGSKDSVLARAAFEVTVNHLLDAAIHGEVDDLDGVIENVIVGKPISLGTGDVDLRMSAADRSLSSDD